MENIDIALNWEQGVFTQILILNLFETMEKTNIYDKRGKQNHNEKKIHQWIWHKNPITAATVLFELMKNTAGFVSSDTQFKSWSSTDQPFYIKNNLYK